MNTVLLDHPVTSRWDLVKRSLRQMPVYTLVTILTVYALFVHGYHPYVEDGGLYTAGIKHLLEPALYASSSAFVDAHLRYSLFAPAVAATVRVTHLGVPSILFAFYVGTLWITLFAVWLLAVRCFADRAAQAGAVMLMASWLTIPVAGTSLILVDPYLTARSIALPCTLLMLVAVIDRMRAGSGVEKRRALLLGSGSLLLLAVMHPLMAMYGLGHVLLFSCLLYPNRRVQIGGTAALCASALAVAAIVQWNAPQEPLGYLQVAASRYYWFLSKWQWYEITGLVAPLGILAFHAKFAENGTTPRRALARMSVAIGGIAIVVALLFAHESGATHLVARLQPLRSFQVIYAVMILMLGGSLGRGLLKATPWRWIGAMCVFGSLMFAVQRQTFGSSAHVELPGVRSSNEWEQAFLWIREHTPRDAVFALDSDYISARGEDAQSFRAIAERSALPDYSKDGGEASITPSLTAAWTISQSAQRGLSSMTDAERQAHLRPFNVSWLVLQRSATTGFRCPYQNIVVKVCLLP